MSIFVDKDTKVLVQGITGREASEKVPEMLEYGTEVLAGVTPGKGGKEVAGVPVYDSVAQAMDENPGINTSLIYVPPFAAKDAAFEAIENDIELLNIITERIPVKDTWKILRKAEKNNVTVVGPTSVGIMTPEECKLGPIGGNQPGKAYDKGKVGIISKSGGMTTETAWTIKQAGYGVSTAVAIGGDILAGTTFADALKEFEEDEETEVVVMYGELGGTYEQEAAELIENGNFTKPLVAFIAGEFTENLPSRNYGHAGAIIRGDSGKPSVKKKKLRDAGAYVVDKHHEIQGKLGDLL
ncbi:succinate--CoA ligase subunit alpha [Candidatus Nanohalococcus occultus]|uniref:Succinyl-CoA synthetase, alpha subunit n=1 Tax=Candidatus Nanohalococcus occultus TaxID=2978047 RepID=A0ABY8CFD8_9ARCH|nr:Succinyl-CoA synthetase, alpha subunit [Candidatus Nanohaloarchaeota archaeon SVXNc]